MKLMVERQTRRTPGLARLKSEARRQARLQGHVLARFHTEQPWRREPYCIAFCRGCYRAVAVSQTRYGTDTFGGGSALAEPCPHPVTVLDAAVEDEAGDEEAA